MESSNHSNVQHSSSSSSSSNEKESQLTCVEKEKDEDLEDDVSLTDDLADAMMSLFLGEDSAVDDSDEEDQIVEDDDDGFTGHMPLEGHCYSECHKGPLTPTSSGIDPNYLLDYDGSVHTCSSTYDENEDEDDDRDFGVAYINFGDWDSDLLGLNFDGSDGASHFVDNAKDTPVSENIMKCGINPDNKTESDQQQSNKQRQIEEMRAILTMDTLSNMMYCCEVTTDDKPVSPSLPIARSVSDKIKIESRELEHGLEEERETAVDNVDENDFDILIHGMESTLLAKELMYGPIKNVCDLFPIYLSMFKENLSDEEYTRYKRQHKHFLKIIEAYDTDEHNVSKLKCLLSNIQDFGLPPSEILKELPPFFVF